MRIAILTHTYPGVTREAGVGVALHSLARALREAGHDPVALVESAESRREVEEIPVACFAPGRPLPRWFPLRHSLAALRRARHLAAGLRASHAQRPFDLVQTTTAGLCAEGAIRAATAPVSVFVESHPRACFAAHGEPMSVDDRWLDRLKTASIRRADFAFVPSRRAAALYAQEGLTLPCLPPPFRLREVEEDRSALAALGDAPFALAFGRICRLKGADRIAAGAVLAASGIPDLRIVWVGADAPWPEGGSTLPRLVTALGNRALHLAPLPHEALYPLVRAARCVLFASREDNLPNTLQEAMSLGALIVAARGASLDELVEDGRSGILFAPEDAASLAAALTRAWRFERDEADRLRAGARERMEALAPARALPPLLERFAALLPKPLPGRA